jgi:hypothetical protein
MFAPARGAPEIWLAMPEIRLVKIPSFIVVEPPAPLASSLEELTPALENKGVITGKDLSNVLLRVKNYTAVVCFETMWRRMRE